MNFKIFLQISIVFLAVFFWFFSGFPRIWNNPPIPPEIKKTSAAIGVQHNWAWGLDEAGSSTMGSRSGTGNDTQISIKVGAARGADTDPVLRLQIVNTAAITSGDRLGLYFTDCTGGVLKTCATRSIGTDPATEFVAVEKQGGTVTGLFRFREADNASVIGGDQHSGVVGLTEHNPPAGAWAEGDTTNAYSIASFTGASYNAHDFSFEFYGSAPSEKKTYIFAGTYNETKPSWSGMHSQTGAILDVLPSPWVGSAMADHGVSITSATTATTTHVFTDDSNANSNTTISYSTTESGTYTTPAGCDAITASSTVAMQDGSTALKRTCDITGLTADTLYFFKMEHTDADGISGNATTLAGPFYMDQSKGAVHMHSSTKDANDDTTDDEGDLKEDDAGALVTAVEAGDGQYTLLRASEMQIDTWTPEMPANATFNSVEIRYQWGMNGSQDAAQKLYIATPGTEPAICSNTGGTNWDLLQTLPTTPTGWSTEGSTTTSGYTIAQLETADMCLANSNNSGAAASDVVAFDFINIIPIFTPAASGSGSATTTTDAATLITTSQAQLNATINTQAISGKAYFEYGTTISYGSYAPSSAGEYVYNSLDNHSVSEGPYYRTITGLTSNTLYNFRACLKAPPSAAAVCGGNRTFTTDAVASLTFVVSTDVFSSLTPGSPRFATTTLSIDTDNSTGWYVTLSRTDVDTTMDLDTDATVNITDQTAWVPGAATTTAGNAVRISLLDSSSDVLAMRVMTASGTASFLSTAWWGTTDAYIDSATTLWAGLNSTDQKIGDSSVSCAGADCALNTVLYYLDVASTQQTGGYSGGVIYTATMNE